MRAKFDNIGIVVKDLEKTMNFYSELLGWVQPKTGPYSKILEVDIPNYKIRYALLVANDCYIELIEPKEGPWVKRLKEAGEGSICKLGIEVDNLDELCDRMEKIGLTPLDRFDQPLVEERYFVTVTGAKLIYLPRDKTYGTWIEVVERPWKKR